MSLDDKILTFNSYLKQTFGKRVVRVSFDTGFGCPWNKCVFCDHNTFVPDISSNMSELNFEEKANSSQNRLEKRYKTNYFFAYFQNGTSTFGPNKKLLEFYKKALSFRGMKGLIVSTRPDYISKDKIDIILEASKNIDEIWIELGLQTSNDNSLKFLNRGHSKQDYLNALDTIEKYGENKIKVAPHLIVGIPNESFEDNLKTLKIAFSSKIVKGVKIHHLQIYKNTKLAQMFQQNPFELFSQESYLKFISDFLEYIPKNIVILRLFASSPEKYLLAPKWNLQTAEFLKKLDKFMEQNHKKQGTRSL